MEAENGLSVFCFRSTAWRFNFGEQFEKTRCEWFSSSAFQKIYRSNNMEIDFAMPFNDRKAGSYPLRLPLTMRRELEALAKREGVSINHLISLAVAEKIVRCQQQTALELNRRQQSETNAPVFGASLRMESARLHENLVGLPVYPLSDEETIKSDWAPAKSPYK